MKLEEYTDLCHDIAKSKGFWDGDRSIAECLMLIVTEVAEACEADRHGDRENFNEEIADTFIRLFDLCGYLDIDIESELTRKISINRARPRLHGKRYWNEF